MTTHGRFSKGRPSPQLQSEYKDEDLMRVHVIGTPEQVERALNRIAHVVDIVTRSKKIPRREEEGQVAVYLKAWAG